MTEKAHLLESLYLQVSMCKRPFTESGMFFQDNVAMWTDGYIVNAVCSGALQILGGIWVAGSV